MTVTNKRSSARVVPKKWETLTHHHTIPSQDRYQKEKNMRAGPSTDCETFDLSVWLVKSNNVAMRKSYDRIDQGRC